MNLNFMGLPTLQPWQEEVFKASDKIVLMHGPRRSGKTAEMVHQMAEQFRVNPESKFRVCMPGGEYADVTLSTFEEAIRENRLPWNPK